MRYSDMRMHLYNFKVLIFDWKYVLGALLLVNTTLLGIPIKYSLVR
jgi:hypothetical protein